VAPPSPRQSPPPKDEIRAALELAYARHGAGAYDEAEQLGRRVLQSAPANAHALHLVGEVALRRGRPEEAITLVGQAVAAQPRYAEAHNTLGLAHKRSGAFELAAKHYKTAIRLRPDFVDAYNNLGDLLIAQGEFQPAMIALRRALAVDRRHVGALNNLGAALLHLERYEEAAEIFTQAASLDPNAPQVQTNLGNALRALGHADRAVVAHRHAVGLVPNVGEYHLNLANSLRELGDLEGAIAAFRRAIALEANSVPAHNNLGGALLMAGHLKEGWQEFEWRWRMGDNPKLRGRYAWPLWNGEDIAGRSLLVWGEQGIGDVILFASMLPDLLKYRARLTLEIDERLVPLFARSFPEISVIARGDNAPAGPFDAQVNIGRLGLFLRPDAASFAGQKPFLAADPARVAEFKARYAALHPGPKIGIAWRSNSPSYRRKSIGLEAWTPLLNRTDLCFVSLQYGEVAADLRHAKDKLGAAIVHDTSFDTWADLDGLAAQIASLDAVVSVSNLNVHVAGAQAIPTHVLLTSNALWYWPHNQAATPWYSALTVHRLADFPSAHDMTAHIAAGIGPTAEKQR
jgi:tetratricopeptide (TPR) repeat protein/ADP-heptose:LPS heptosyltransferase